MTDEILVSGQPSGAERVEKGLSRSSRDRLLRLIPITKGNPMLQARRQGPSYWYEDYPNAITDEDACEMVASDFPMATVIDVEVRNADNPDDVREYRVTRQVTFLVEAAA